MVAKEMVEADEVSFRELLRSWNELDLMSDEMFQKLDKEAVERLLLSEDDISEFDTDELIFAYDDLMICELLDG